MASLAVELKISPNEVLDLDERMFKAVLQVLNDPKEAAATVSSPTGIDFSSTSNVPVTLLKSIANAEVERMRERKRRCFKVNLHG